MPVPSVTSRLLGIPLVTDRGGRTLFEIRTPLRYRPLTGTVRTTLRAGNTLFHLAFQAYGDSKLWWAIADFNDIFDATTEMTPGREILIPPRAYIEEYLTQRKS